MLSCITLTQRPQSWRVNTAKKTVLNYIMATIALSLTSLSAGPLGKPNMISLSVIILRCLFHVSRPPELGWNGLRALSMWLHTAQPGALVESIHNVRLPQNLPRDEYVLMRTILAQKNFPIPPVVAMYAKYSSLRPATAEGLICHFASLGPTGIVQFP